MVHIDLADPPSDWTTPAVWLAGFALGLAFYLWLGAWLWGLGDIPRTL